MNGSEFLSVEDWPCPEDSRPDQRAVFDFDPPPVQFLEITAHVASARHAARDHRWDRAWPGIGEMDMHVPQAGNHELSGGIHNLGSAWNCDLPILSDGLDVLLANNNRHPRLSTRA